MGKKNRVDMLNVLRVLAFLTIFLLHAKSFIPVNWNENFGGAWLLYTPAWGGTWIFFLLSGYGVGSGFYGGKYEISKEGILHYYWKRIRTILPLYYFWLFLIAVFIKPEIMVPSGENIGYWLKLLLLDYRAEFYPTEFGLGWYLGTLMRLYLAAPLGYYLLRKTVKSEKQVYAALAFLTGMGLLARCLAGYRIASTGSGNWSLDVYTPFYFNLDLFFSGMLLNHLKEYRGKLSGGGLKRFRDAVPVAALLAFILLNSRLYYEASYFGGDYLGMYMYVFPSVYLLLAGFYVYCFAVRRDFVQTDLDRGQVRKNPMRIFDYFPKIQFPVYLFHNTVLLCLSRGYDEVFYQNLCSALGVTEYRLHAVMGCLFTVKALLVSVVLAAVIHKMTEGKK